MKKVWRQLKITIASAMMMALLLTMTVFAGDLSGDNSLASLGVENGSVTPEFEYSTWEYDVTVAPGTTELRLNPVPSNANAQILSIDGTVLGEDGTTTVIITVQAENGETFPYTLHVTTDQSQAAVNETEAPAPETEAPQTEAPETENQQVKELETRNRLLASQASEYKGTSEMQMKIIYGLIALAVILIFVIVNQLLRNKDLKEDLREIENHIDSHAKDKNGAADTYYTPQQGRSVPKYVTPVNNGNYQEETFRQVEKNPQQDSDKTIAKKQAKADKKAAKAEAKAAKAEAKAAKKTGRYEQQPMNEQPVAPVKRQMTGEQPVTPIKRQPSGEQPVMPTKRQSGGEQPVMPAKRQPVRQPQSGANGQPMNGMGGQQPMRQPQNGMNGSMMRQPQNTMNGQQGMSRQQPEMPKEPAHSNVEVDMIDL
ncbi:MAG: cadherin-like beta sandwich domain-containing protein [Lachnospiraceae bacterium]|nr:cadherin-like beta sandwich domain-containing protein [Robinsoniella sp.]MDY3767485.1 cadherin-like beta sandwich domain-containing protein [Lachnospiraceae bacterium]